jgi:hypothetical protein
VSCAPTWPGASSWCETPPMSEHRSAPDERSSPVVEP